MNDTQPLVQQFECLEKDAKQTSWLFPLRKAGITQFAEKGFPTIKDEDWRFTNVAPITRLPFKSAAPDAGTVKREDIAAWPFGELPAHRLVFVNGYYAPNLSSAPSPNGVVISNLASALQTHTSLIEKPFAAQSKDADNAFAALNSAFFQDGGFIYVPAGKALDKPVHLVYISTANEAGVTIHPRNLIVVEKGAQATVLETYASVSDSAYFTNAVTELVVENGGILEHSKFQDEASSAFHMATIHARLGKSANQCRVPYAKIFWCSFDPNHFYIYRYPAPARGAYRDRHGRWARDAMDAAVSGGRTARQTNGTVADGEVVWS